MWKEVQEIATGRQGSRMAGANRHPATRRTYVLRHYVHHASCDKRIFGKTRRELAYYTCQPQLDRVANPQHYADHPRAVYVREDRLLDCVQTFFQRVLGPDRAVLLRHQMAKQGAHELQTIRNGSRRSRRRSRSWGVAKQPDGGAGSQDHRRQR